MSLAKLTYMHHQEYCLEEKNDKLDFIKIKNICFTKNTVKRLKDKVKPRN